jgi:hypothetical protein
MLTARALVAAALVLAGALAGCGGDDAELAKAPPPADERSPFLGVNGDNLFYPLAIEGPAETLDRHLDWIASAPISFVRSQLDWRGAEPAAPTTAGHTYDLAGHDRWVQALAAHGLRWAPSLLGWPAPEWATDPAAAAAGCGERTPPADPANYAAFAAALAERYGRDGSFWREHPGLPEVPVTSYELWNEPNIEAFWCPAPDPEAFAVFAEAAARAVRAVDPRAEIVFGALVPLGTASGSIETGEFVARALEAAPGLAPLIDAVGVHPYGPDPTSSLETLRTMRGEIDDAGLPDASLIVNELGWPSEGTSGGFTAVSDDAARASYLADVVEAVAAARAELNVAAIAPYTWTSPETNSADQNDWFGLADPETTEPNPVGDAFLEVAGSLGETQLPSR